MFPQFFLTFVFPLVFSAMMLLPLLLLLPLLQPSETYVLGPDSAFRPCRGLGRRRLPFSLLSSTSPGGEAHDDLRKRLDELAVSGKGPEELQAEVSL